MQEKIYFKSKSGYKLCAILSTPEALKSRSLKPIVIMCHGLNSTKDSSNHLELEKIFLPLGIAAFRFDFFAHGESEGNKEDRSVEKFVQDILSSIEYVKSLHYNKIGIFGTSFGGVVSVIAASRSPELKVMALKAAGMGQTSRHMMEYKIDFDTKSWIKAGKKVNIPTLITHGTLDKDVEVELGKELSASIKKSTLKLYPGADHRFTKKEDFELMIKDISEFMITNLLKDENK